MHRHTCAAKATVLAFIVLALTSCPGEGGTGNATFDVYVINGTDTFIDEVSMINQSNQTEENVLDNAIPPGKMVLLRVSLEDFGTESGLFRINVFNVGHLGSQTAELGPGAVVGLVTGTGANIVFTFLEFDEL